MLFPCLLPLFILALKIGTEGVLVWFGLVEGFW